jgi:hypothetical protein
MTRTKREIMATTKRRIYPSILNEYERRQGDETRQKKARTSPAVTKVLSDLAVRLHPTLRKTAFRPFGPEDYVKYSTVEHFHNGPPQIRQIRVDGRVADVVWDRNAIGVYWGQRQLLFQDNLGRVRRALRSEMTSKELRDLGGETVTEQE